MSERQWDKDWFDQFKSWVPAQLTTLVVDAGQPLWWCQRRDEPYGKKQTQINIRNPQQGVKVSKNVEYDEKYAKRLTAVKDLPSVTDALDIDEEDYAGDPVNASGHVGDLAESFIDGLSNYYIVGTSQPLSYGLLDAGAGTGSTTVVRPDVPTAISTAGDVEASSDFLVNLSAMEGSLNKNGFRGPKVICTHPIMKPFIKNLVLSNTATSYRGYLNGHEYAFDYSTYYDIDATTDACDVYMLDANAFLICQTPIIFKGFKDENLELYRYRWKTRGAIFSKPKHDGTDYKKGIIKCTMDIYD
jgi:hypothetical protein